MKRSFLAFGLALSLSAPALADDAYIANGGCNADMLPVWVAQGCAGSTFTNADAGGEGEGNSSSGSGTSGGASK